MNAVGPSVELAGLNLWSSAPEATANLLSTVLGIQLTAREEHDGQHFSGRSSQLFISVHPSEEPGVELACLVDDEIESAISACAEHGARLISGPESMPYGVSAHLRGPGDTRIELVRVEQAKS